MTKMTRKEFLNIAMTTIGAGVLVGPIMAFFYPSELEEMPADPVPVAPESELPLGKSKTVPFGRYPALVIHTEDGLKAYSAVCTHFACVTSYDAATNQIVCPCHEGYFDPRDGRVLAGPPPSGLLALNVQTTDGIIYVGGES